MSNTMNTTRKPTKKQKEIAMRIKKAARLFATKTRDVREIASALNVNERTVYRLRFLPDFHTELDELGYQGDRTFQNKPRLKKQKARKMWETQTQHLRPAEQVKYIASKLDLSIYTVRNWIQDWKHE